MTFGYLRKSVLAAFGKYMSDAAEVIRVMKKYLIVIPSPSSHVKLKVALFARFSLENLTELRDQEVCASFDRRSHFFPL